jgi:hypothetical protein
VLAEPLLIVRRVLREQFVIQRRRLLAIMRDDEVCRHLMMTPSVGPAADIEGLRPYFRFQGRTLRRSFDISVSTNWK